jgi:carbonic anhydrase/acetyltransferase-like protein (isoleucine patch superfamily)
VLVAAGATVAPDSRIEAETLLLGEVAKRQRPLTDGARWWVDNNPATYQELARRHRDGVIAVD